MARDRSVVIGWSSPALNPDQNVDAIHKGEISDIEAVAAINFRKTSMYPGGTVGNTNGLPFIALFIHSLL